MYIHKKHQFFWYDKNTVRTTSNRPMLGRPMLRREGFPRTIACCYMSRSRAGIFQLLENL